MIDVIVKGGELSDKEKQTYLDMVKKEAPDVTDGTLTITVDGDYIELDLDKLGVPFQRIRRITGYLVGTLDRFNNAKRAEVNDRVKHTL